MTEPQLSISDIEAAERLFGIAYTQAERAQMVGNLEGQIASAKLRRGLPLANSVPRASRFDPRLPGFGLPGQGALSFTASTAPLPVSDEDIAYARLPLGHQPVPSTYDEVAPGHFVLNTQQ